MAPQSRDRLSAKGDAYPEPSRLGLLARDPAVAVAPGDAELVE